MMLSAEQTRAVMHGTKTTIEWRIIDRPEGPSPLVPGWCKDVSINWMDNYANCPDVRFKVTCDVRSWDDQRYRREGKHFRSYHPDGRMEQYSQSGDLRMDKVRRWKRDSGEIVQYPQTDEHGTCNRDTLSFENPKGEWVEVERLCTRQEQGFGGSHYDLTMEDGTEVTLRGPWHTGSPEGYTEVAYVDPTASWRGKPRRPQNWQRMTGMAGLYVRNDVFIAIMSKFAPHIELAEVTEYGMTSIQPLKPEWDAPKCVILHRRREAREAAKAVAHA